VRVESLRDRGRDRDEQPELERTFTLEPIEDVCHQYIPFFIGIPFLGMPFFFMGIPLRGFIAVFLTGFFALRFGMT
jgi:hypothetical protein